MSFKADLTEEEAFSRIKEIIQQFDYPIESLEEKEIIDRILTKGVDAINEYKTVFGSIDSKNLKTKLNENKELSSYLAQTRMLTNEEKRAEITKILTSMGYDISEEPRINEFLDEFVIKGSKSIEKFKDIFGIKHEKTLLANIEKNPKLHRFNRLLSQNFNETEMADELNKELLKLDYDKSRDSWINNFIKDFLGKEKKDLKVCKF